MKIINGNNEMDSLSYKSIVNKDAEKNSGVKHSINLTLNHFLYIFLSVIFVILEFINLFVHTQAIPYISTGIAIIIICIITAMIKDIRKKLSYERTL